MLTRIIYVTKLFPDLDRIALEEGLTPYREWTLNYKARHNLTGAFVYCETRVAQAIEGDSAEIDKVLEIAAKDTHHFDFQLIEKREIQSRTFPDWTMAYAPESGFCAAGTSARDLIRFLIEAAQHCNGIRAIPGFVPKDKNQRAA